MELRINEVELHVLLTCITSLFLVSTGIFSLASILANTFITSITSSLTISSNSCLYLPLVDGCFFSFPFITTYTTIQMGMLQCTGIDLGCVVSLTSELHCNNDSLSVGSFDK